MKQLAAFCMLLLALSCTRNKDEEEQLSCANVDCMNVQGAFFVKFINSANGQNMIANGSFDTTGIKVTNKAGEQLRAGVITGIDSLKNTVNFMDNSTQGNNSITIMTKQKTVEFTYVYNYKKSGCCGIADIKNIRVKNFSFAYYPLAAYKADNYKIIEVWL